MVMHADIPFAPTQDYVLLERLPQNTLPSGIALPDGADIEPPRARIVAIGPGKRSVYNNQIIPIDLEVGQIVYLVQSPMSIPFGEVQLQGKRYLMQRAEFLIATYNG